MICSRVELGASDVPGTLIRIGCLVDQGVDVFNTLPEVYHCRRAT